MSRDVRKIKKGAATESGKYLVPFVYGQIGKHREWANCRLRNHANVRATIVRDAKVKADGFIRWF